MEPQHQSSEHGNNVGAKRVGIRDTTWRREAVPGDPVHRLKSGHSRGAEEMERGEESTGTAGEVWKRPVEEAGVAHGVTENMEPFQAENELRRDWRTDYSIWCDWGVENEV